MFAIISRNRNGVPSYFDRIHTAPSGIIQVALWTPSKNDSMRFKTKREATAMLKQMLPLSQVKDCKVERI